ncbi:BTB/POZ domain-containing protein [Canna indica]|uniref:BTB/POZ domain-containing protein n=1 Tax=Canna indica TaxID=4628 RepID=A0AAQ3K782_9LILI|nr:BTB/POZ domain-containing protein [Canna indica]
MVTSLKRKRSGSSGRLSFDGLLKEDPRYTHQPRPPAAIPGGFNDPATSDVLLRLQFDPETELDPDASFTCLDLHLQSAALLRSQYFAALLSDRWQLPRTSPSSSSEAIHYRVTLKISRDEDRRRRGLFDAHVAVLRLLHTLDFSGEIASVSDALEMIPVALELLFDECASACVRFLEAVPWTEDEEETVLKLIPFLGQEESQGLLDRVSPMVAVSGDRQSMSEEMLHGLIDSAIRRQPSVANVKAFVARVLKDFPSPESVGRVLNRAFLSCLETVEDYLGRYASPDLRVAENSDEREAIQRVNLHAVVMNVKHLYWLVERIIEVRAADTAVREWSEQQVLAADLIKTFMDDTWKNIVPGLPLLVTRCSYRLADAVASGVTLAPRQVRKNLVRHWLPVLNVLRDISCPFQPHGCKKLYLDLEETFLKIISTLPLSDAQDLLQQCLSFTTRDLDDCSHLTSAFKTWFRRANRPPHNFKII